MTISPTTLIELAGLTQADAMSVIKVIGGKFDDESLFKLLGYIIDPGAGDPFAPSENFAEAVEAIHDTFYGNYETIREIIENGPDDTSADDEADYRYGIMQDREAAE